MSIFTFISINQKIDCLKTSKSIQLDERHEEQEVEQYYLYNEFTGNIF